MLSVIERVLGLSFVVWIRWIDFWSTLGKYDISLFYFQGSSYCSVTSPLLWMFPLDLSKAWIMQKGPGVQINQRPDVPEPCTHTHQWIELIPWASKQPAVNAERGEHWDIVRLQHNLFCKNKTNYYLLHRERIYSRIGPPAAQITLLATNFAQ